MFVAAGIGAYPNAMFHLMTHAFFKALLFLAAGIIIHSLSGEQDIRRMGGLGSVLPHTRTVFLIGSLALVGIPPFAGFFSKDSIIAATLAHGGFGDCLFAACLVGAFLTGIYAFRLYFIVFGGERSDFAREHLHEPHGRLEGPPSMVWTVSALALLATVGGFLQFADVWHPLSTWLAPALAPFVSATNHQEALASIASVACGLAGIGVAWALYGERARRGAPKPLGLLEHAFYWDRLYGAIFYAPAVFAARALAQVVEQPLIAGSITGVTSSLRGGSGELGRLQNGLVRSYVLAVASGVAILAVVFISTR
jgi:NADH-quinone oxidoreductase subunit L